MEKYQLSKHSSVFGNIKIIVVLVVIVCVLIIFFVSRPLNKPSTPDSFAARLSADIPGFVDSAPLDQLHAIQNWIFENTNLAGDETFLLTYDKHPLHALTLDDMLRLHHENIGGHFCAGVNYILKRAYEDLGYRSWMYSYGDSDSVTHAVALVELEGKLYLHDAYLNLTYVDGNDRPVPFYTVLKNLVEHREPQIRVGPLFWRNIHIKNTTSATGAGSWALTGIDLNTCKALKQYHLVCKSRTSLENFMRGFPQQSLDRSYHFLRRNGLPESLHYLLLFPLGVTGETWVDNPEEDEILQRIITIRDSAQRASRTTE